MRFEGTIKTWNNTKGIGFLTPAQGGQDIYTRQPCPTGLPMRWQNTLLADDILRRGQVLPGQLSATASL